MRTEQEIRERIKVKRVTIVAEEEAGRIGGEEWETVVRERFELKWVLGE